MSQVIEFIKNHTVLVGATVGVLGMFIGMEAMRFTRPYKEIDIHEAIHLINHENATVLDVRSDNEFFDGHILHARHIPGHVLPTRLEELSVFKEKPIIVYCRTGQRSSVACSLLHQQGYHSAVNLRGGILAWQNANLPIAKKR